MQGRVWGVPLCGTVVLVEDECGVIGNVDAELLTVPLLALKMAIRLQHKALLLEMVVLFNGIKKMVNVVHRVEVVLDRVTGVCVCVDPFRF